MAFSVRSARSAFASVRFGRDGATIGADPLGDRRVAEGEVRTARQQGENPELHVAKLDRLQAQRHAVKRGRRGLLFNPSASPLGFANEIRHIRETNELAIVDFRPLHTSTLPAQVEARELTRQANGGDGPLQ